MTDAEFVKQTRKAYGITQTEFAGMMRVTLRTVQYWEGGGTLPPIVKMAIKLRAEKDGVEIG